MVASMKSPTISLFFTTVKLKLEGDDNSLPCESTIVRTGTRLMPFQKHLNEYVNLMVSLRVVFPFLVTYDFIVFIQGLARTSNLSLS